MSTSFPLLDCLNEPSVLVDGAGLIVDANRAFAELLHESRETLRGKNVMDLSRSPRAALLEFIRQCCQSSGLLPGKLILKDGTEWRLDGCATGVPSGKSHIAFLRLRPQQQAITQFLALSQKVTELELEIARRQQAEDDLRAANALLEKRVAERTSDLSALNRDLESFTHAMAHDLRAPLRTITGFVEVLRDEVGPRLSPDEMSTFDRIVRATVRMSSMLEDLLAYSRIGASEVPLQVVRLPSAVLQAREALRADLESRRPELVVEVEEHQVMANPALLQQVLQNLISNAFKFVPPERSPQVRVRSQRINGHIRVAVEDNGIGISKQEQSKLFTPFRRLVNAAHFPGTGIGLAIVARAIERMGGSVGVESEPAKGSCFWFELPNGSSESQELGTGVRDH